MTADCRHEWKCDGWTVDPLTSVCRVCGGAFVFWSKPSEPTWWLTADNCNTAPKNP
jgi:hypothetical protein